MEDESDRNPQAQALQPGIKPVIDKSCGKSAGILFFALFLLMLIILGNTVNKGSRSTAWMLYSTVILLGLGAFIVLILGVGYTSSSVPWLFSALTLLMSFLGAATIVVAKPSVPTYELATTYIAVLLPGLCGVLYSPVLGSMITKFQSLRKKRSE